MIWQAPNLLAVYQWHRWFAWHPVEVEDDDTREKVWLEHVERRKVDTFGGSHWEYRFA